MRFLNERATKTRGTTPRLRLLAALLLFGWGIALLSGVRSVRADDPPAPPAKVLRLGLDPDEVRAILGSPSRISRQLISHRAVEQWVYNSDKPRLVFHCRRGQKPTLVRILRPPLP